MRQILHPALRSASYQLGTASEGRFTPPLQMEKPELAVIRGKAAQRGRMELVLQLKPLDCAIAAPLDHGAFKIIFRKKKVKEEMGVWPDTSELSEPMNFLY